MDGCSWYKLPHIKYEIDDRFCLMRLDRKWRRLLFDTDEITHSESAVTLALEQLSQTGGPPLHFIWSSHISHLLQNVGRRVIEKFFI
jgi:hypothetical protein